MTEPRRIVLSGELAKRYGRLHHLAVSTPAEVVRAFCANYPDFERFILESGERNVGYRVLLDDEPLRSLDELHYPAGKADIHIVPVIAGSKSGFGQIFLAAAFIAAAFIPGLQGVALFSIAGSTTTLASISFSIGVSLALGGVSQLLSPQPKSQGPSERPENKPSYSFDGAVNTTAQGQPVPVGYGRLIIGSAVISAGITADNYS